MITKDAVTRTAHAKINLTLHVTGQRPDGYHLLDSLVMFASFGDLVTVVPADKLSMTIDGRFAAGLSASEDNLVLRAARLFDVTRGAAITLTKNLPVASGIGGGSADAAATLLALSALWSVPLPDWTAVTSLGADVGVCMSTELTRMSGIGEDLTLIGPTPPLDMILVNPRIPVATPQVFAGLTTKTNAPMSGPMPDPYDTENWFTWLASQRNDLEAAAIAQEPVIAEVLDALRSQPGCAFARMSGSGATCFAVFDCESSRNAATLALCLARRNWWIAETHEAT